MIDMQEFWTKRNEAKQELADNEINKQEKEPKTKQVPQGVQELFNIFFRLQPRHENKPSFNAYQAQFELDDETLKENQKIQDIIGHTFLGMAISKSSDTMAALDLVMEPSPEYQKEITSIENIVNENVNAIQDELEDDKSEREITEIFKDLVLDSFDDETSKPKYVRDLLATMDDADWYHLALQFVEINELHDEKIETLKSGVRKEIKSNKTNQKFITKEEGDLKLEPLRAATDKDLKATEDEIVMELLKQYKPVLRANKVLEFRRMNIMLNWFNNNINTITNGEALPALDDSTKQELDDLTQSFSDNINLFITDPKSEVSKKESRQYLLISKQVYNKFGNLMKEYIRTPEAKEAIAQGLEELVNKKTNTDNIQLIVAEFLKQFEALKN
jgi:hypothetical protein